MLACRRVTVAGDRIVDLKAELTAPHLEICEPFSLDKIRLREVQTERVGSRGSFSDTGTSRSHRRVGAARRSGAASFQKPFTEVELVADAKAGSSTVNLPNCVSVAACCAMRLYLLIATGRPVFGDDRYGTSCTG
jgi:hypothetical protein